MDFSGIAIIIYGGCWGNYFYPFYCSTFYICMHLTTATIITIYILYPIILVKKHERDRKNNNAFLAVQYSIMVFFLIIPVIQITYNSFYMDGPLINYYNIYNFIAPFVYMIITFIIGIVFFVSHFPERYYPGTFDYIGQSHNIWHIFVFLGVYGVYNLSLVGYNLRIQTPC